MHPAGSLILFTTLSGLGFGLMAWLGLGARPEAQGWAAFAWALGAGAAGAGGLAASLAHLGNPQRAWRAFSQWRTSWLSREGVVAVAALGVFGLYGLLWALGTRLVWLGAAASALALVTVLCTAMIYAQLRTVPRWRHWTVPVLFQVLALAGGAMAAGAPQAAAGLLAAGLVLQAVNWHAGDRALAASGSDAGTATGLGGLGRVRLLEGPHTGRSYLTREMAFRVARNRSRALRRVCVGLGFVVPAVVLVAAPAASALALVCHLVGVAAGRWLFYAEAEHVQSLYYGLSANRA